MIDLSRKCDLGNEKLTLSREGIILALEKTSMAHPFRKFSKLNADACSIHAFLKPVHLSRKSDLSKEKFTLNQNVLTFGEKSAKMSSLEFVATFQIGLKPSLELA